MDMMDDSMMMGHGAMDDDMMHTVLNLWAPAVESIRCIRHF